MMIKKIVSLLIVFSYTLQHVQAQSLPKVEKVLNGKFTVKPDLSSRNVTLTRVGNHVQILTCTDRARYGLFTRRLYTFNHVINDIDVNTKRVKRVPLPKELNLDDHLYIGKLRGEGDLIKYYFKVNHYKTKKQSLVAVEYNQNSGSFVGSQVLYTGPANTPFSPYRSLMSGKSYEVDITVDQKAGVISIIEFEKSGKQGGTFSYVVKNYKGDVLTYGENIKLDYPSISNIVATPTGGIYFFYGASRSRSLFNFGSKPSSKPPSHIFYRDGKEYKVQLQDDDENVGSATIFKAHDNRLMLAQLVYPAKRMDKVTGIAITELSNDDGTIVNRKIISLSDLNITAATDRTSDRASRRSKRRNQDAANSLSNTINDVVLGPDGTVYILVENFTVTYVSTTDSRGRHTGTRTYYNYGPGIVHCLDINDFSHKGSVQLVYYNTYPEYRKSGIDIVAGKNRVYASSYYNYFGYPIDNKSHLLNSLSVRKSDKAARDSKTGKAYTKQEILQDNNDIFLFNSNQESFSLQRIID